MQNSSSNDVQVTVRLGAIAIIVLVVFGGLGWLRYDLGRDAFYTVLAVASGVGLTLLIASITGVGFRLAQRSDNKEIALLGVFRGMTELLTEQRKASTNDWRALNEQAALAAKQSAPALPMWDDDDDDEPVLAAVDDGSVWVGSGANGRTR